MFEVRIEELIASFIKIERINDLNLINNKDKDQSRSTHGDNSLKETNAPTSTFIKQIFD